MNETLIKIAEFGRAAATIVAAALEAAAKGEADRVDEILPAELRSRVALQAADAAARERFGDDEG